MKNTLKIFHKDRIIEMDRTFEKNAQNTMSDEYQHLQNVRRDYPTYTVQVRRIKKNQNKKSYKGLNYPYMKWYIQKYDKNAVLSLKELERLIDISMCHSRRYPIIKNWFLEKYPEIAEFGMPKIDDTSIVFVNVPLIENISNNHFEDQE